LIFCSYLNITKRILADFFKSREIFFFFYDIIFCVLKTKNMKNFAGFTLIELLVVIVIIGVLATISVSTFGSYQEKARNAKITSMMKQFDDMMNNFAASNGYYFPRIEQYSSRRCLGRYEPISGSNQLCGFRNKNTGVFTYLGSDQLQDDNKY